ncbi:hypothetical protein T484DRAFT_1913217 [Baffinella frigidus]|nr:hypothetical protein T484DRAFT_1913217 [Cryptophyta sp. CCMP2293]
MRDTDDCMEMVRHMTAELFREKRELVERLNAMQVGIEEDNQLESKVLRKVEWMSEKERSVKQLKQMVTSLQEAIEADAASGEIVTQCPHGIGYTESEVSDSDHDTHSATPLNPMDFSRIFCEQPTASNVNRIQTELCTSCMPNLDQGFVRAASAQPAPSGARRLLLEPPPLPPAAKQPRALWTAQSHPTASWFTRNLSMPGLPKVVRETLTNRIRRMSTSMIGL